MQPKLTNSAVEAYKESSSISVNLNPQDAKLAENFKPGNSISLMIKGVVKSISMGDYGSNLCVEADLIAVKTPEEEKQTFVEEMSSIRVSPIK